MGQKYRDFPTDKFGTAKENTGAMNTAPVFLVVEPSPILRPVLHRWLEEGITNSRILTAVNAAEALSLADSQKPFYVLTEINLPDQTPFKFLPQLRQTLPEARIVATSWFESRWFRNRVLSTGADGFLVKDELRTKLLGLWNISMK